VRRVEEVHPELDRAAKEALRLVAVAGLAEDPRPGNPHRAEAHPVDGEVASERDRASGGCGLLHQASVSAATGLTA
jgi:hypothetical protein